MTDAFNPDVHNETTFEIEAVIACLGDDAAALREENPESEVAANMERAAELLSALPTPAPTMVDERGEFEAHYAQIWKERTGKTQSLEELCAVIVSMRDGDNYNDGTSHQPVFINALWQGWQARAARPTLQSLGGDAGVSEREAFEAFIRKDAGDLSTFGSGANVHYQNSAVNNAWGGWKARSALSLTSTEKSDGWISVEERLPEIGPEEEGIPVWTWDGNTVEHDEFVANYEQPAGPAVGGWLRTDDWFASDLFSHVTHWQPYSKPAAPKAAEKSGRSE